MKLPIVLVCLLLIGQAALAQPRGTSRAAADLKYDSAAVARIIDEGTNHSHVMEILTYLSEVIGSRLTASPSYIRAAEWTRSTLAGWGLSDAHFENWGPWGHGWAIKRYSAQVTAPVPFPLISYPKAWSPGTGTLRADAIYLDASADSTFHSYKGKLDGKIVFVDEPVHLLEHFAPDASRLADSSLLQLANADPDQPRRGGRLNFFSRFRRMFELMNEKLQFCKDEGAAAIVSSSRGDYGTVFVQSASFPSPPGTPRDKLPHAYDPKPPAMLPQIVVAAEHYNRILHMLALGVNVRLEINFEATETREDSVANVIAELPGTDLKDEVVMLGGHLDSWHSGTGSTDDGTGVAASMEAMRILKTLGLQPRRTIRVALWGGEEEGLLGSRAYVTQHFGTRTPPTDSTRPVVTLKPESEHFCVYFNHDNGTGKFRGIYLQGYENLRTLFRSWLAPFRAMGASTVTARSTGSTDHVPFDDIGLPGFQFIQDQMDYDTRTHHSNMDVLDRVQEEDMKQAAVIMAAFVYNAAMRDEKFPRK